MRDRSSEIDKRKGMPVSFRIYIRHAILEGVILPEYTLCQVHSNLLDHLLESEVSILTDILCILREIVRVVDALVFSECTRDSFCGYF
ncbi:hypothetical protein TNCT_511301 [Trichonephila clavata]|uniref:Uncharacterized protein n=1 Tax=Trichonephila clavata TaxID=2740835 RepID=A0A8X6F4F4_TRICU|nr:hypothetical protein TNCT_511301 [Trichonephila clavata]